MRRFLLGAVIALFTVTAAGAQTSAGGGISFFFPESLLEGSGSVSRESGISSSLGLGQYVSIPVGFTYIKASGLMAYDDTDGDGEKERLDDRIWYVADTFLPYLRIKGSFNLGPVFIEGFGGVAGTWIVAPQAFEGAIGRHYGGGTSGDYYVFHSLKSDFSLGYGFQFGAAAGMTIDKLSVGLKAVYTDVSAKVHLKSDNYDEVDGGSTITTGQSGFEEELSARLRGLSLGIIGSFQF